MPQFPPETERLTPNLFAGLPSAAMADEQLATLLQRPGLRIERIVSTGQSSPPDFWYDQEGGEWVLLAQGEAGLELEGEPGVRHLRPGDFLHLPPHLKHRVAWTAPNQVTVWLAIHYDETCSPP